ncbi:hypothetical protein [Haladaptatus sp. NG-SE-30]
MKHRIGFLEDPEKDTNDKTHESREYEKLRPLERYFSIAGVSL